ncbi:MAG: VWA domain-containing protein [Pseudomonadales bacterium]
MLELAYPWAFILLPLPWLAARLLPVYKESRSALRVPFFETLVHLSNHSAGTGAVLLHRSWIERIWQILAWMLLVTALASPYWLGEPIERTKSARDLMVAVDLSGSMQTKDFHLTTDTSKKVNRLAAVRSVLHEFAEQRQHDRLGLIVFGDAAFLQAPFTEDHRAWLVLLEETQIGMAGQSTMFGDAIGLAIKLFENSDSENRVLIMLTDGNDTGSKVPPVEAAKVAASKGLRIYTIAIGNPLTVGEEALDLEVLQRIAEITGGNFYQALDRTQLDAAYQAITELEPELFETLSFRPRHSLLHWPLGAAFVGQLLLLLVLLVCRLRRYHKVVKSL